MKARPPSQKRARQRAEAIMKVRCGLLSASQAARQLGVSRKTYYKWEERGLSALLGSLEDQPAGRPQKPVDRHRQALEKQLAEAQRESDPDAPQDGLKGRADGAEAADPGLRPGEKK